MLARLRKAQENNEGGFTLIELLVVMIIIGILAAIAIPAFLNQKVKAAEAAAKSDATNIAKEVQAALVDGNIWSLGIAATTGGYTLSWVNADGAGDALVKGSNDMTPTVSGATVTTTTSPGAQAFCVTVTPGNTDASAWSAGNNGLKKGTSCPA